MGLLGATCLMVMLVVVAEAQVVFPTSNSLADKCTASNGQKGFCHEFRSSEFRGCSFFPSQDTRNPNVARHLTANVCKNTGREVFFCCPSKTDPCATFRCQANAQCVSGSGNKQTKCNCNRGYRSYQNSCIETCNVKNCQANSLCVEGSGSAASVCLCKKGYRPQNGQCLPTCKATTCPKNARCLEGSGSTGTSCKCKNGYKSTRTACIELKPKNPVNQRLTPNRPSTQGFGGSSTLQNQRNTWDQFRAPTHNQFQHTNQQRPTRPAPTRNPYQYHYQNNHFG